MRSQHLERFVIAEGDENLDAPLGVIVLFAAEADLAEQAEGCEERGESVSERWCWKVHQRTIERSLELFADFGDERFEAREPEFLRKETSER